MPAQVMDGTSVAEFLIGVTASGAAAFEARTGRKPCLVTVLVGDDPASHTYVRMKRHRCARVGMVYRTPTGWRGSRGHQRGVEEGRQLGGELVGGVFGHVVSAVDGCAAQVGAPGCPDR